MTVGAWLVYSSLKGQGLADVFKGGGESLNPEGGSRSTGSTGSTDSAGDVIAGEPPIGGFPASGPTGDFKGPNAAILEQLRKDAVSKFKLRITQTCRPKNATYGAPNSRHKVCSAFDASGAPADMKAYAIYAHKVVPKYGGRVYYDPLGWVAPGYNHTDHVHTDVAP